MKNKLGLLAFFTILAFTAFGQETKQVKREKDGDVEVFQVLKSDKNIKQGPYEKYFKYSTPMVQGKLLKERGQYDNNKKAGIWAFYWGEEDLTSKGSYDNDLKTGTWEYYKNGVVIEKGEFVNDKREGLWNYFDIQNGVIERGFYKEGNKIGKWSYMFHNIPVQTYDYSLDSVLQFYDDKSKSEVISGSEVIQVILSRPPQYIGHKRHLQEDMTSLTEYPLEARRMAIEGKVSVSFVVNENGTTSDFAIVQDIGKNCGKAVIDAFKANPSNWIPGIYNGRKVKVKYYQTVSFILGFDPISGLGQTEIVYE